MKNGKEYIIKFSKQAEKDKIKLKSLGLDKTLHDAYYDLAAGTAVIMREDSLYGTQFKKLPFTQYKLGTEQHQTVCRSFEMPAYQIGITWPELANKQEIGGVRVDGATKYQEIKLNDVLYYNESTRQYEYYLRYGSEILLTRIYKSSPYHIFHWGRIADMPYSAGVALKALPALKRLNSFIKANLELIPFQFPMFLTTAGNVLSKNLTFKPGGFLTVRDMQGFQPLTLGANRSDFKLELQTEEIAIKETFLDSTLPSVPRDMTAAEVNARITPYGETANVNVVSPSDIDKSAGLLVPLSVNAKSNDKCWSATSSNSKTGVEAHIVEEEDDVVAVIATKCCEANLPLANIAGFNFQPQVFPALG